MIIPGPAGRWSTPSQVSNLSYLNVTEGHIIRVYQVPLSYPSFLNFLKLGLPAPVRLP